MTHTDLNNYAKALAQSWPVRPDFEALNAIADALGGKGEARHQRAFVACLRQLQRAGVVAHFTVVPNEAMRRRWQHWVLQGAQEGTPDLIVGIAGGRTLWIERKYGRGGLTDKQREARDRLVAAGHVHYVPRSAGEDLRFLWEQCCGEGR